VRNITSEDWANDRHGKIDDDRTVNNASHYGAVWYTPDDHGTAHVSVLAENGDAVSATGTINL
jgi:gamma-glutamyltranspeptidase / glutathione hydrolase / leukotriene-C4 hydrolase